MTDCIIIGGGIIGMLSARYLRQEGKTVTLIEKGETGSESSWAGGGIVSPLYPWRYADKITNLASWSQTHYESICTELLENTGIDPQYTQSGLLIFAPEEQPLAIDWSSKFSRKLKIISGGNAIQIEPSISPTTKSAIWLKNVAQIRNPRLTKALRIDIERLGVNILTHTQANCINTEKGKVVSVSTNSGNLQAEQFAICSGAWTGDLLRPLGAPISVEPVKGQMLLFKTRPGDISRIVLEEDRYIIPRRDGRVLYGSTVEYAGFDKQATKTAKQELHGLAIKRFPLLKGKPIEHHWAGLRPGSPQGIPIISRHPDFENLFINAGHFRNGVVLGPASCRLLSEMMLEQKTSFNAEDYSIS